MLTTAQLAARDGKLTASRVACLMTGDEAKIMDLWREMVGDPGYVAEDLSGVWAVQLGSATEALNLDWYERKHGALTRRGEVVCHPLHDWATCTLDAWDDALPGPVEAKHVGGYEPLAKVTARYMPQLHWQMLCTGSYAAALSVIEGTKEPTVEIVPFDVEYATELWRRAEAFMACVYDLTPPVALAPLEAPVKAEKVYDLAGNNEWAAGAADWLANAAAAKKATSAEKALKALVPADAARCHGYGVQITRDRAGRLSLKEMKS